ncbi:unnamed protein product [Prorocentrum cordatum]|uniref:Uncharacterized protein n=1 Tax=Prorocentrum cordatum TaxID=2364126 RepID=A0ABN9XMM7_9DINO|nr:unnamed protein product [Polarella glacialis]
MAVLGGCAEELKRSFACHGAAVRGALEQLAARLEGLEREHEERLVLALGGSSPRGAPAAPAESEARVARDLGSVVSIVPESPSHGPQPRVLPPRALFRGAGGAGPPLGASLAGDAWGSRQPSAISEEKPAATAPQRGASRRTPRFDRESGVSSVFKRSIISGSMWNQRLKGRNQQVFVDANKLLEAAKHRAWSGNCDTTSDLYRDEGTAQWLVQHPAFNLVQFLAVALNTAWIGIETDYNNKDSGTQL